MESPSCLGRGFGALMWNLWKAVQETIRICRDRDILRDYLGQEEAATIMFTLADQEKALQLTIKREREEERAKVEAKAQRQLDAAEARADAETKRADAAEARVHELERQLAEMKT